MASGTVRVNLRLPRPILEAVDSWAELTGQTRSEIVTATLGQFLIPVANNSRTFAAVLIRAGKEKTNATS